MYQNPKWLPTIAANCIPKIVRATLSTILKQLVLPEAWQTQRFLTLSLYLMKSDINIDNVDKW